MRHAPSRDQHGFSLLEFAIVIVIIGLIIGLTIMMQSMLRNARLQSVATEVDRFTQAITNFHDKYGEWPGDMANAESFWGTESTGCPPTYTATPHATTCNGDGDGVIWGGTSGQEYEIFRAWQELANAAMIEGSYNGMADGAGPLHALIGINSPASQLTSGGYTLMYSLSTTEDSNSWAITSHMLVLGAQDPTRWTLGPLLSPSEALSLDTKLDDGFPAYGKVMTYKNAYIATSPASCTTSDTASASRYVPTTSTTPQCPLIFLLDF